MYSHQTLPPKWHPLSDLFSQTKIADLVQIAPEDFGKQSHQAIEDNINAKYANKVRIASRHPQPSDPS